VTTPTIIAITGIDDLLALPVGVKIQDRDGDVFTKTDLDTYVSALYEFPTHYLVEYLPGVVLPEPVEFLAGDDVRVISEDFLAARVVPGDLAKVDRVDEDHIWVRFSDNLYLPFKREELELVRRDIEFARTVSDGVIDKIVGAFRKLLDRAPTATKDPGQVLPPAQEVLITSTTELSALPDGSVVAATVETTAPTRYKDGDNWRAVGKDGTFNYTTAKLAQAGKLRLVYKPTA
jgi:hypothetical protein